MIALIRRNAGKRGKSEAKLNTLAALLWSAAGVCGSGFGGGWRMSLPCSKCGKPATKIWRCESCYRCDVCHRKPAQDDQLCTYSKDVVRCNACEKKRLDKLIAKFKRNPPDTDNQNEAICPHCGYKHMDSWEYEEGEHECSQCERAFELTKRMWVTFTTRKVKK